ncbi:uncharacterized protein BDV14DRAFT_201805 [Aspergillus stella-maris]|uniref:uncharacterized protein n=1 Tax=Aspergillus stella-maris TaxID=1810926 RepID=UPI003CCDD343
MPSNQWHTQARPHLSEILGLYPDDEPFCAGYAYSQGRRCHCRTNAHGRKTAIALLNEGTTDLYAGRCIDDLLENVSPHVLCTRFHQNQAMDLATKWQRTVDRFWEAYTYIPPTPVRERQQVAKAPASFMSKRDLEEALDRMSRSLQEVLSQLERERRAKPQERSHSRSRSSRPEQNRTTSYKHRYITFTTTSSSGEYREHGTRNIDPKSEPPGNYYHCSNLLNHTSQARNKGN